jgi:hypothetical protein
LSRDEVRVTYHFHNKADHDIATLIAFPLPVMNIGEEGNYDLGGRDPVNVMDFQVTAEGKQVEPSVEIKATRFGVDVTDILKRYDIPLTMLAPGEGAGSALNTRLDDLPQDARQELERYGVIDWNTTFGAENKPLANTHWDTHIIFYWFQTFPAGSTIEVTHRYKPVPRRFFLAKDDLATPETRTLFCMDQDFISAAQAALKQSSQDILAGTELKYVLTTAGNWLGAPIQKFRLDGGEAFRQGPRLPLRQRHQARRPHHLHAGGGRLRPSGRPERPVRGAHAESLTKIHAGLFYRPPQPFEP